MSESSKGESPKPIVLSAHDVRRICVTGEIHPGTVQRAYRGEAVRSTSLARIVRAARALDLPLPPRFGNGGEA